MQSIKRTAVVLAFILALSGVVSGAPIINWNACTEISARLNQLAQHFAREVLDGSRVSLFNISEQVVLVEPRDMCDPAGLKIDSEPCLQKIITALGNYSRIFQKRGLFVGSKKEMAQNVVATVSELLGQLRAKEPEDASSELQSTWMRDDLVQYSVERLLSFSVLVSRVFAVGNPAAHGDAPPTQCHRS